MKKLVTQAGIFGPYREIEVLDDRYRCDGVDFPFTVVGEGVIEEAQSGDFPLPEALQPEVPQSVTMRQARLALLNIGKLNDVDAALASIPDETLRKAAQIEWEYALEVQRNHVLVQQIASSLGLGNQTLDNLFIEAGKL
ncbi:hypothetical protein [Nitrosomonas sp. Nm132]|uniref:hypothetical protein n=1 Tax=Nitrosomonas sp. Nm132 TaxID=1881053 RepID=UPI00088DEBE3|nr:hypothetical protein [Nitrosomonas sp. Nm132]SDH27839.1 hypothetical protein SAMN05428952_100999 [Nitrosomonas sp. Nm132]